MLFLLLPNSACLYVLADFVLFFLVFLAHSARYPALYLFIIGIPSIIWAVSPHFWGQY